jgi:hypothetical protein
MPRLLFTMLASMLLCAMLVTAGCKSSAIHTSNPQLKQIDVLINQQLPPGTSRLQVNFFLNSRGYPSEHSADPHVIVATIEHVDTETLRPSAARVRFLFDPQDKLLTYDMAPTSPTALH